jgi:hypothetical protein
VQLTLGLTSSCGWCHSTQVSLETVERLAAHYNLRTVRREFRQCLYTTNNRSMLQVCGRGHRVTLRRVQSESLLTNHRRGRAEYVHVRFLDHDQG